MVDETWGFGPTAPLKVHKEGAYEKLGADLGRLVDIKQESYGDSFGISHKFLSLLYPDGVPVDAYKELLILIRIFDKMKRIATNKDALGEDPYRDIAGYALLGAGRNNDSSGGE